MLSVYRRHSADCKHKHQRVSKKCDCPLWAKGSVEGHSVQQSLKTRALSRAEAIARQWEETGIEPGAEPKIEPPNEPEGVTINHVFEQFLKDAIGRNLRGQTITKYRTLMAGMLRRFEVAGLKFIGEVTTDQLVQFRDERKIGPRTSQKELARIRAVFNFAVERGFIEKSPAKTIRPPKVRDNPTLPFTDRDISKILSIADFRSGVFFRVLLHSGLRVLDAAQLRPEKIIGGKLFLYTQKTGVPVMIPLPPDVLEDLKKLKLVGGYYFAIESERPESIAEYYRCKLKNIDDAFHPHRFRDTFAIRLLERGVPLETVSVLLGHTDVATTWRSYSPWVKSLQDKLELAVQQVWTPALVRVK